MRREGKRGSTDNERVYTASEMEERKSIGPFGMLFACSAFSAWNWRREGRKVSFRTSAPVCIDRCIRNDDFLIWINTKMERYVPQMGNTDVDLNRSAQGTKFQVVEAKRFS